MTIPAGGMSAFTHEGTTYEIPTVVIQEVRRNAIEDAVERVLDAVTRHDRYEEDGKAIKEAYDCCGCAAYMNIVRDSITAMRSIRT